MGGTAMRKMLVVALGLVAVLASGFVIAQRLGA
jgi:hypothetical protein